MRSGRFSRYYNTYSLIHLLNPLCKILAMLVFLLMVFISSSIKVIIALFLILFFLMTVSNVPFRKYFRPIYGMKVLLAFIIILNFLLKDSFYVSIVMVSKICLVVLYSSVLMFTTTTNGLAYGFASLLRPLEFFGIDVTKISMAIALSLNFIPSLFDSSSKIMKSQMSRGFDYKDGSFMDRVMGIRTVFIPMFVNSIKRADSVSEAMEVKNFNFDNKRSSINDCKWHFCDFYMITCHLLILIMVLVKEVV